MSYELHKAHERGHVEMGWLTSFHSFSFGRYYNPKRMEFGALKVINDDIIGVGGGFGAHPHDNMEIITIPLSGALRHEDNLGHKQELTSNEVQVMSAGSGIVHGEYNASLTEPVALLQLWISPNKEDISPRYDQKEFDVEKRKNTLQLLVSPDGEYGSLTIEQNAWITRVELEQNKNINYALHKKGNGVFMFVISGEIKVADEMLNARDAVAIVSEEVLSIHSKTFSDILIIEVPQQ